MKTEEIIKGIESANCKTELTEFLDMVSAAVDRGECDYNGIGFVFIGIAVRDKMTELRETVFH